ncbi:MAG: right-handed parallel beta-helix repeat-containing protein [Bacteroidales bacterium]|nr:right-handed parallel beta-helix repeat-containing protein [Bacteroidales bacterium]MCF8402802.1 right-handed parallel beta-helix repeat-containing protein [Bacteroidales bacterium]
MKQLVCLFFFVIAFSFFLQSSNITITGPVSGTIDTDTVFVVGDVLIENGQTLTVVPGVEFIFMGHYMVNVAGSFQALGTIAEYILYTVNDTTGFYDYESVSGGWNGFWFDHLSPSNDSSIFEFCKFKYGKAVGSDTTHWYGGAICIREFDKIRISDCDFVYNKAYKNGGAIYSLKSDIKIEHSVINTNLCGQPDLYGYGGGVCLEYSDAQVALNIFTFNQSTGVGGGLSFEYSNPRIVNNTFTGNYSAIGGGMVCLRSDGSRSIVGNLLNFNGSLFFGGGVALIESSVLFANNTIANNISGAGGGLYFNEYSFSVFQNCILWGNEAEGGGPQIYIWDTYSAPEFYYCDIQDGLEGFGGTGGIGIGFIGIYENCLEMDPLFDEFAMNPYCLAEDSPCVDAGNPDTTGLQLPLWDLLMNYRFDNGSVDIGAFETNQEVGFELLSSGKVDHISPNPVNRMANLLIPVELTGDGMIMVHDFQGRLIKVLFDGFLTQGSIMVCIDVAEPGQYLLTLVNDRGKKVWKLQVN